MLASRHIRPVHYGETVQFLHFFLDFDLETDIGILPEKSRLKVNV